jgi:hypothetical protein
MRAGRPHSFDPASMAGSKVKSIQIKLVQFFLLGGVL